MLCFGETAEGADSWVYYSENVAIVVNMTSRMGLKVSRWISFRAINLSHQKKEVFPIHICKEQSGKTILHTALDWPLTIQNTNHDSIYLGNYWIWVQKTYWMPTWLLPTHYLPICNTFLLPTYLHGRKMFQNTFISSCGELN